ncbi:argininosuccinate lyase, chloroplastic-like [Typha angustifolia]|uniref:argininosuccinate lyase, chloroplastic-like n=1 Tax=Typha angustifolia TaxID=59011 RepID=UPI003C302338
MSQLLSPPPSHPSQQRRRKAMPRRSGSSEKKTTTAKVLMLLLLRMLRKRQSLIEVMRVEPADEGSDAPEHGESSSSAEGPDEAEEVYEEAIVGCRTQVYTLAALGFITSRDRDDILVSLNEMEKKAKAKEITWRLDKEDVYMNIEAALVNVVGEPAKRLHIARSRNALVVTDLLLWSLESIEKILASIKKLQVLLVNLASKNEGLIIPGYIHQQRAQPVLLQHHLLSYVEQLERDAGRLTGCKNRMNFCPLIPCALAGKGLPADGLSTAENSDFKYTMSTTAVPDHDFVMELLSANSTTANHLKKLCEDWILWASEEFGFLNPSDSVSNGSSNAQQKKHPDPLKLVCGNSARVVGYLVSHLVLYYGLPQGYNRDLPGDEQPLVESVQTISEMLTASTEFAESISFNRERIQGALEDGHLDATTLAVYLLKKGVPFRFSHEIVGRSVALCIEKKCQLSDLTLDELQSINPVFEEDVYNYLGVENSVKKLSSYGSTCPECVAKQLTFWVSRLGIS